MAAANPQTATPLTPQPPAPGLINQAPGSTTAVPGVTPTGNSGPGSPVTSYTPATAQPQTAQAATYTPNPYTVTPNQTTAGQLKDIIASGSPLMQQAEANANNLINQRGLVNSSIGVGAAQGAVIAAAEPIAASDAAAYQAAMTNTVNAQNQALSTEAAAKNTAGLANQSATNTALGQAAAASNTQAVTAQQIAGSTNIQQIQSDTAKKIADIQSSTTLTAQDKQDQTQTLLTAMNNAVQQQIAAIQADTSLSVADKQAAEQTLLTSMNNENARAIQQMQNDSSMANILANGVINTQITNLTDQNRLLLQSSSGAATIYNQALSYMASIATDVNMSADQKATALNNAVQTLNDALNAIGTISGTPSVQSLLTFAAPVTTAAATGTATGTPGAPAPGYNANNQALLQILGGSLNGGAGGNSTPLQDIARALSQGATITDAQWAQAGLPAGGGPTGAALMAAINGAPQAGLINQAAA